MPDIRRSGRGRGRGARAGRQSRHVTNRPRILRYRWWLLARSRHGTRALFLLLVVGAIAAFALLRRMAVGQEEPPLNSGAEIPPSP